MLIPPALTIRPRYWLWYLGLGLLQLILLLPYPVLLSIGRSLGRLFYYISPFRRKTAAINIQLCFPMLSPSEQRSLLKKNFQSAGMGLIESAMAWWWPNHRLQHLVRLHGLEHLDALKLSGKGAILIGIHFTCLEMAGRLAGLHLPFYAVYREHLNPMMEYWMHRGRHQNQGHLIHRRNIRQMIKVLKQGHLLWYAPDQDYGLEHSISANFFDIPAATVPGVHTLAKLAHVPAMLVTFHRRPAAAGYDIVVHPPINNFPSHDIVADTNRVNSLITAAIRENPVDYLWIHRRFKSLGVKGASPYPAKVRRTVPTPE